MVVVLGLFVPACMEVTAAFVMVVIVVVVSVALSDWR